MRVVDALAVGAAGDGSTDDTDALQRALDSLHPSEALRLAAGRVFCHSRVLRVTVPHCGIIGGGTLLATQESTSAVQISAAHVALQDIELRMGKTTQRWSTLDQHKLVLDHSVGTQLTRLTVDGSAAAGVFCFGASHFDLTEVRVANTRADGIHMTNGSHDGRIYAPQLEATGDDGVAVVSYLNDDATCRNIYVMSPRVVSTRGGRGISVVGGDNVQYRDIAVARSDAAGVYIACEGGDSVTRSTTRVRVARGTVTDANVDTAIDHGAVLVYSGRSGGGVSDVEISGLRITETRTSASRQIGVITDESSDLVSDIRFVGLHLAAEPTPYEGNAPVSAVSLHEVTAGGQLVKASQTP